MTTLTEAAPAAPRAHSHAAVRAPAAYQNPYLAGIGLGLVLLAAYVVMGRGLGASGAVGSLVACRSFISWPRLAHARSNEFFSEYLEGGVGHPLKSWLVFEVLGLMVGAFVSGALAGRLNRTVEKGPRISVAGRLGFAFLGGGLMGFGAKLARGCTSGQALSGGAALNAGSWAFMMMVFAGAYALARVMRKEWR